MDRGRWPRHAWPAAVASCATGRARGVAVTRLLNVEGVRFAWNRRLAPVLDVAQFSVDAGERVFLRGPSGTGKSTLLGLVGGVLVPQQGSVSVLGQLLGALSSHGRDQFRVDHIGFVFQQFNLIAY
ncbi:MAG: methionine transporter ATP-binding protein, partial [Rhizobacter sp.]|nr:methionine transporter ATP-binding protein [Rhizobacter sp.]